MVGWEFRSLVKVNLPQKAKGGVPKPATKYKMTLVCHRSKYSEDDSQKGSRVGCVCARKGKG